MSFLSRLFSRNNTNGTITQEPLPEIREEDFVDNSDPNENVISITNDYSTGFPIDAVYSFLNRDYEQIGFTDAVKNPDPSYKDTKKNNILTQLKRCCDQVKLKYSHELREIEVRMAMYKEQGLLDTCAMFGARKETYLEHVKMIEGIKKLIDEKNPDMLSMTESYEIGFKRGMAEMAQTFINKSNN